jgi:hypothetical protein
MHSRVWRTPAWYSQYEGLASRTYHKNEEEKTFLEAHGLVRVKVARTRERRTQVGVAKKVGLDTTVFTKSARPPTTTLAEQTSERRVDDLRERCLPPCLQ